MQKGTVTRDYQRPLLQPSDRFDWVIGSDEPAAAHRIAHDTAWALLDRVRGGTDPEVVERVLAHARGEGIADFAELWARESPHTLAGALWRLSLLRRVIEVDALGTAELFARGQVLAQTADPVVAGAEEPITPHSVGALCDTILRGVFVGDFAIALERAAAACRIISLGAADLADDRDAIDGEHASALTKRALRFSELADDLHAGARRWNDGSLG